MKGSEKSRQSLLDEIMAWKCTKKYCTAICAVVGGLGSCVIGCVATGFAGTVVGIAGATAGAVGASASSHFGK
jgi:hypothetical protein